MKQIVKKDNKLYHTTAIGLWIKSGSINDPLGKEGLHHFLEHIYFKDPVIMDAQNALDQVGVLYNAFTSHELTCFLGQAHVQDTSYLLEFLLKIDNCRLNLTDEEIEKEKRVIIEEINYYNAQPFEVLKSITIKSIMGQGSRYANNICGSKKGLMSITKADIESGLEEFHANKTLVISGAIEDPSLHSGMVEKNSEISPLFQTENYDAIENNGRFIWSKFVGQRDQVYYGVGLFIPAEYKQMSQVFSSAIYKAMKSTVREKQGLTYRIRQSHMQLNNGSVISLLFQTSAKNLENLRIKVKETWESYLTNDNLEESLSKELVTLNKLNFIKADTPIGEMKKIAMAHIFPKEIKGTNEISFSNWLLNQSLSESVLSSGDLSFNQEDYYELC